MVSACPVICDRLNDLRCELILKYFVVFFRWTYKGDSITFRDTVTPHLLTQSLRPLEFGSPQQPEGNDTGRETRVLRLRPHVHFQVSRSRSKLVDVRLYHHPINCACRLHYLYHPSTPCKSEVSVFTEI